MIRRYDVNKDGLHYSWEEGKYCLYLDVKKLEKQNKQLLDALTDLKYMICSLHQVTAECNHCDDIKSVNALIESITGKKPEEL